ncbi:MAG: HDOD domain-containing protein [Pseudomonadota bacterium]|nr:HDOD domain-containing protein [Pseudomonadota bacterium]
MLVDQKNSVDDWVDFLGKEHMPALAETVQKLSKLTTDDDSRVSQLTEQILKDPSLTTRVLQISNSVVYKGLGGNIKTITRAIVMLGFTTIRDISLSMQILDNILKQNPSEYLMGQIANSFHAAMQARSMLRSAKAPDQEEIFISTLLLHFAELSMLSRDDEVSRKLNLLLRENDMTANDAAMEVLGFSFDQISVALAKQWELGDILVEVLSKPKYPSKLAQAVILGDELSQVAMLGWNSDPVKKVIKNVAKFRDISFKDAMEDAKQMADMAQDLAVHYGAAKVRHLIPNSDTRTDPAEVSEPDSLDPAESNPLSESETGAPPQGAGVDAESGPGQGTVVQAATRHREEDEGIEDLIEMALTGGSRPQPVLDREDTETKVQVGVQDVQLQMDIMQKLNMLIADKRVDVNQMFSLVMGGMLDAIGLDRVVMALVAKDRKVLVPKFFKGQVDLAFKERLKINLLEENTFSNAIRQSQQFWMGSKMMAGRAYLHTAHLDEVLGYSEYFVAPIIVSRRPIGIFYGDQGVSKRPLNDQQYAGFTMLAQQAGLALTANQS